MRPIEKKFSLFENSLKKEQHFFKEDHENSSLLYSGKEKRLSTETSNFPSSLAMLSIRHFSNKRDTATSSSYGELDIEKEELKMAFHSAKLRHNDYL